MYNQISYKIPNQFKISSFFGISIGCFVGVGYGLVIGFGKNTNTRRSHAIVCPARNPFVYTGLLNGCYCGIIIGIGFGSGLVNTIGIKKIIEK